MALSVLTSSLLYVIVAVNVQFSSECPDHMQAKAAYKSGEVSDQAPPVTIDKLKIKLKESGVFNADDPTLTDHQKKELSKLFEAVEIMISSRNRQPSNAQPNMFASMRMVERALKKQVKEGQISEGLANKFNWEKLSGRTKRSKPTFSLDKATNMRVFNINR